MTLFLTERDMEQIISKHSELIEEGLVLIGRQVSIGGLRVDLLFRDRFGETLVVELKRGTIKREHVGQIMEYSGSLYEGKPVRLMLVGNRVPPSFQRSLEYHGIEWRELREEKLLRFLEVKDRPLLERLRRERVATIPAMFPTKVGEQRFPSKVDVEKVFQAFEAMRYFVAGEGITEESVESWHQERRKAKEKYAVLFSPSYLGKLTREDFESFLYYRNNRAWTNLYRRCKEAARNIGDLRKAIAYLQNESIDIRTRINSLLRGGSYYVRGMGKNLATSILHVCDKMDRYGVWNNRTEGGLKKLGRLPIRTYNYGEFYYRINMELNQLKEELDTDLIMVDGFMWYIDKELPSPTLIPAPTRAPPPPTPVPDPKAVLNLLESEMRDSIEEKMVKVAGRNWWRQRAPQDVRLRCEERKRREESLPWWDGIERPLISYVDFSDYIKIIMRNWQESFQQVFRDKDWIRVKLRELESIRNAIAHNRHLSSHEIQKLKLYTHEILRCLKASS